MRNNILAIAAYVKKIMGLHLLPSVMKRQGTLPIHILSLKKNRAMIIGNISHFCSVCSINIKHAGPLVKGVTNC